MLNCSYYLTYCSVVLLFILIYLCILHSLLSAVMFLKAFITDKNIIESILNKMHNNYM